MLYWDFESLITSHIRSLNWLSVSDKPYVNDAVMTFMCIYNLVPDYLADKFTSRSQITSRNTRQSNDLNIPRCLGVSLLEQ